MFAHSIRWRLQLWLGFLLVCILSGVGVAIYQLHRVNQLNQIDEELERRVGILSSEIRRGPMREFPGGPPPDEGPGPPPENRAGGPRRQPRPEPSGIGGPGDKPPGTREIRLSSQTAA